MKRMLIVAAVAVVSMMAMGLASRDLRQQAAGHAAITPHDAHLRYYEGIRPALVEGASPWTALCRGDLETSRTAD